MENRKRFLNTIINFPRSGQVPPSCPNVNYFDFTRSVQLRIPCVPACYFRHGRGVALRVFCVASWMDLPSAFRRVASQIFWSTITLERVILCCRRKYFEMATSNRFFEVRRREEHSYRRCDAA